MRHPTTGLILGKFLPPHLGHSYLVEFARKRVDELTVLVCSIRAEPIPGELRYAWMREMHPDVRVVHVTDEVPQAPEEHPEFWSIWQRLLRREMPVGPDLVFTSEDYGDRLAEVLGAKHVLVDRARAHVPVSGTQLREHPMRYWEFLPECVRPYFVRRVCLSGPESTGKSTLARDLATHYGTVHVEEFARGLLDPKGGRCDAEDIPRIAAGQAASEDALARRANRLLFCDTDLLLTTLWSEVLFGSCPAWIYEAARARRYDLTLLLDVDVPWVDDAQRFLPHRRAEFLDRCIQRLEAEGRPYVRIRGTWDERFRAACAAVDALLAR